MNSYVTEQSNMDNKLVLVKAITLVYLERLKGNDGAIDTPVITDLVEAIPNQKQVITGEPCTITALKDTLAELMGLTGDDTISNSDLIQRVRINAGDDVYLVTALEDVIAKEIDTDDVPSRISSIRRELETIRSRNNIQQIINKASTQCAFNSDSIDWKQFVPSLINQLESNYDAGQALNHDSLIAKLDFTDKYAIKDLLMGGRESICGKGIMRTGWQGLNDMCDGGIRRGELIVIGALKHNFKSGMLLNIPRQIIKYNKPYMYDPTKKPIMLHFTLENEIETNVITLYNLLWEKKFKTKSDISKIASEEQLMEAAEFIEQEMSINGYTFHMLRFDPSALTYDTLFNVIKEYEADNYEIHLISVDYLSMMSYKNCTGTLDADRIRDLFRRCRNFFVQRHITLLTAHQLSSDAIALSRDKKKDFVKEVANKSYYDRCKGIGHEADLELTINIEKPGDGYSYLAMARGKHRKPTTTAEKHLYQVYRFEEIETIPDDIEGKSNARKVVGGGTVVDGGEDPWYGRFLN